MAERRNILLYPLSLLYGFFTGLRNFLYNSGILKSHEFDIPVICVGNITVGGTGKTPHTEYIASVLEKHFRVATLSRGYLRKSRGFVIASPSSKVRDIGDEPKQISGKLPRIVVAVDRNRVHGINRIMDERPDTGVIILDDGFQHRKIKPGFTVLLSDFSRLMIRDTLLPYGNLRESIHNMKRADIIIITKSPLNLSPIQRRIIAREVGKAPYQHLYFTSLTYGAPVPVFGRQNNDGNLPAFSVSRDASILLVTAIANPLPLKEYLEKEYREVRQVIYRDHHNYRESDIRTITRSFNEMNSSEKYIFTTEKDAVKLMELTGMDENVKAALCYIPVGIHFLNDDSEEFDNIIINYVRKSRGNNHISKIRGNR